MLFKELDGMEIIDKNGERVGFVQDIVFTTTGRITHVIAMPKGILSKMKLGQLNIQFEDIAAIEDVLMLNKSEAQLAGKKEIKAEEPKPEKEEKPLRTLLKKKVKKKK